MNILKIKNEKGEWVEIPALQSIVDPHFDPTSENAQSGKAVKEAIANNVLSIKGILSSLKYAIASGLYIIKANNYIKVDLTNGDSFTEQFIPIQLNTDAYVRVHFDSIAKITVFDLIYAQTKGLDAKRFKIVREGGFYGLPEKDVLTEETVPISGLEVSTPTGEVGISTEQGGEIFNDYENNQAVSEHSTAHGHNTVAGVRGFNVLEIRKPNTLVLDSVDGLDFYDFVSIITATVALNWSYIERIYSDTNTIVLSKNIDFELNTKETTDCEYNYLFVVDKPTIGTSDISEYAFACGYNNLSLGKAAHTEGANNISSGWYSHTEGRGNEATDYNTHAEGRNTKAKANSAHTEGRDTEALAPYTHAEGFNTKARANCSHTEGTDTETTGWYAHAENYGTKASGMAAHAENARNEAIGNNSHAGGSDSVANGSQTFVHGLSLKSATFKGFKIVDIRRKEDNSRDIIKVETTEGLRSGGIDKIGLYIDGVYTQTYIGAVYDEFEFETTGNAPLTYVSGSYMVVENNNVGYDIAVDNQFVVGKFNKPTKDALFVVGNGKSDADRTNAFEVYDDGHAEVHTMGESEKSVVNKGYVDELTGDIETALDELHNYAQLLANGGAV